MIYTHQFEAFNNLSSILIRKDCIDLSMNCATEGTQMREANLSHMQADDDLNILKNVFNISEKEYSRGRVQTIPPPT